MNTQANKPNAARLTLEQQRAQHAWQCAQGCSDEYMKLSKGLPALIIGSGLMQTLAYLHEKGKKEKQQHHRLLGEHLRKWLDMCFPALGGRDFDSFMQGLMKTDPRTFQEITRESLAWLRWMRQLAAAIVS